MRRLVLSLVLALVPGLPSIASAEPFVVAGATTIEGGTHTFPEQVIVTPGSTLTIKNATIYLDAPRSCPIGGSFEFCHPHLFVMPGGTLIAEGATFDTHRPVDPATDPSSGYMVYAYAGTLQITDSTFLRQRVVGGELPGPSPSVIADSSFSQGIQAISLLRGMEGRIERNTIENNRFGIDVRDSSSIIRDNVIRSVLGYGIDVQSTAVGDKALPTRATIERNVVTGSLGGLFTLNGYSSTVRHNVFSGNKYGAILGVNAGTTIVAAEQIVFEHNLIENSDVALRAYATINQDQRVKRDIVVPARNNSIVGTTCTAARVTEPTNTNLTVLLDARYNWWGSAAGPQDNGEDCPATIGPVEIDPWLMEPPA